MANNGTVYIVDAHYESQNSDGVIIYSHKIIGVYYNANAAVNMAMTNADIALIKERNEAYSELTENEIKDALMKKLELEGSTTILWTPMQLGRILAKNIWAEISEFLINS